MTASGFKNCMKRKYGSFTRDDLHKTLTENEIEYFVKYPFNLPSHYSSSSFVDFVILFDDGLWYLATGSHFFVDKDYSMIKIDMDAEIKRVYNNIEENQEILIKMTELHEKGENTK